MNADLISAFVLLFLVLDPLGNLALVASLLKQVESKRRARIVIRECFIAYLILLAFMFGGRQFLDVMNLSEISLSIAGGVILFMIAINMVFKSSESVFAQSPELLPVAVSRDAQQREAERGSAIHAAEADRKIGDRKMREEK